MATVYVARGAVGMPDIEGIRRVRRRLVGQFSVEAAAHTIGAFRFAGEFAEQGNAAVNGAGAIAAFQYGGVGDTIADDAAGAEAVSVSRLAAFPARRDGLPTVGRKSQRPAAFVSAGGLAAISGLALVLIAPVGFGEAVHTVGVAPGANRLLSVIPALQPFNPHPYHRSISRNHRTGAANRHSNQRKPE